MSGHFTALSTEKLNQIVTEAKDLTSKGKLPEYIPLLANFNTNSIAAQILTVEGENYAAGDVKLSFPLMSAIKPFLLLYLLSLFGSELVLKKVGREPSMESFNSLNQLKADGGWPRNPMINSGAITLASLLPGENPFSRCENFCNWLNFYANCHLFLDKNMLASVESLPNQNNKAIASLLRKNNYLQEEETITLDTYNHICCLSGNIVDVARLAMLLVQSPPPILKEHSHTVITIMQTCGLYQTSAKFAVEVGLSTKSGVSGVVFSVIPNIGAIACYSPPLDSEGHSLAGLFIIKQLAQHLKYGQGA